MKNIKKNVTNETRKKISSARNMKMSKKWRNGKENGGETEKGLYDWQHEKQWIRKKHKLNTIKRLKLKNTKTKNSIDGLTTKRVLSIDELTEQAVPQRPPVYCETDRPIPDGQLIATLRDSVARSSALKSLWNLNF